MTATFWGSFAAARGLAIPAAILLSPEVIMWTSLATAFGRCSDPYVFGSPGSGSGLVRGMDPDPDPLSSSKNCTKNFDSYCLVILSLKN
jgi:hypothetical protein